MQLEKNRIKNVYESYDSVKSSSWRGSLSKAIIWEDIFTKISESCAFKMSGEPLRILEVGTSSGGVLIKFKHILNKPDLFGLDIRLPPLQAGAKKFPFMKFACCDAVNIPFKEQQFDVVVQFTCLSSILDRAIRKSVISEMKRVLKAGGYFISMDLRYWSPNPNVVAISKKELHSALKVDTLANYYPVWLLPPLQRKINSRILVRLLLKLRILSSHWLCIARKINK